jgi:hypothetical protein
MNPDIALILGIFLLGVSLWGVMSAISERRGPTGSALVVFVGIGMVVYAMYTQPGGYTFEQIPDAFKRVFGL